MNPARLILEDGTVFPGEAFGATGTIHGEVVFNTAMTGYQEILTDPSYAGQLIAMTYPLIGNVGTNPDDQESPRAYARGFIVKRLSGLSSSYRSMQSLDSLMREFDVHGIGGVDTRRLTLHIRDQGAMQAVITTEPGSDASWTAKIKAQPRLEQENLVEAVTCKTPYDWDADGSQSGNWPDTAVDNARALPRKIAVMDFGIKRNILKLLRQNFREIRVFPAETGADTIMGWNPDGLFLSNGPGDPKRLTSSVATIRTLLGRLPIFGICLGHQLLALALGADTYKLKFGHHGANHPIHSSVRNRIEITSQNHGFAVAEESLKTCAHRVDVTHVNLNDATVAGIEAPELRAFSVQYHPESSPGPHDSRYLFENFVTLIQKQKKGDPAPTQGGPRHNENLSQNS